MTPPCFIIGGILSNSAYIFRCSWIIHGWETTDIITNIAYTFCCSSIISCSITNSLDITVILSNTASVFYHSSATIITGLLWILYIWSLTSSYVYSSSLDSSWTLSNFGAMNSCLDKLVSLSLILAVGVSTTTSVLDAFVFIDALEFCKFISLSLGSGLTKRFSYWTFSSSFSISFMRWRIWAVRFSSAYVLSRLSAWCKELW